MFVVAQGKKNKIINKKLERERQQLLIHRNIISVLISVVPLETECPVQPLLCFHIRDT